MAKTGQRRAPRPAVVGPLPGKSDHAPLPRAIDAAKPWPRLGCPRGDAPGDDADGAEFEILGRTPLGEECRSSPAVAGGLLLFRSKSKLHAVAALPAAAQVP